MNLEKLVEEMILDAIEAGEFDNLPGAGKPLRELEDSSGEDWMAFHILKSNGFLPEWLELRKQIAADRETVVAALDGWRASIARYGSEKHPLAESARGDYMRLARSINAKIDLHNLRCPSFTLEIARFREDARP